MYGGALTVNSMEGTLRTRVHRDLMVTVVAEALPRAEGGRFADDAVSFDNIDLTIGGLEDPASAIEGDRPIRQVGDCNKVDEGVGASMTALLSSKK